MNYVVDKVRGGVKRGCVHFDTPSQTLQNIYSRKDIASAVSFFRVNELTSGQVNELIAIGGTETEY